MAAPSYSGHEPYISRYMNMLHITPYKTIYTVGHKKGATFIFTITLANVDRFQ